MDFRISDTFLDSLARLTGDEQKAVKTTAFDLQMDPVNPGMQLHKLDRARDKNFWSVRVSRDIRLIVHRTGSSFLLCYVAHHDDAYAWAERRKLETHPTTGAAQIVEVRELVREIEVPRYVEGPAQPVSSPASSRSRTAWKSKVVLFEGVSDEQLLALGVPAEWIADVRAADEDGVLDLAEHLPAEAAEALLQIAVGGAAWGARAAAPASTSPEEHVASTAEELPFAEASPAIASEAFEHPDAQRRFRLISDAEELARALEAPWDKWTVFLHPAQREIVEADYAGPARISGSAGTGKTIVALHRAVHLARQHSDARVLLATFSEPLAAALRTQLRRLISGQPRLGERLEVHALNSLALRLYELNVGEVRLATRAEILDVHRIAKDDAGEEITRFGSRFLVGEWDDVVDAWDVDSSAAYRTAPRLGRKTQLTEKQRALVWPYLVRVSNELHSRGLATMAGVYARLASHFGRSASRPFDFVIVDEAQDVTVPQMRFLAALGADRPNGLFFAGDLGQRIFQLPFSWKSLGVDVKGRSHTLHINYRTSQQIRGRTDLLLAREIADVDGNVEARAGTISVLSGPEPEIHIADDEASEIAAVAAWLRERRKEGFAPHELGVFVRSIEQLDRGLAALIAAGIGYVVLDERLKTLSGHAALATMHLAKGLEFRGVVVMGCDDEVLPLQARIDAITDPADLEEVYNTERHLLYVACTRARDQLFVSGVKPGSEFLKDLGA